MGLLFRYLESNPRVGMVGPLTVNEDMSPRFNVRKTPTLWTCFVENLYLHKLLPMFSTFQGRALPPATYERTHEAETLSGCFMLVRREAVDQVGLLDERFFFYSEDVDWCNRFSAAGWKIVFYPESKAIHYGGGSTDAAPIKYLIQMEKANYQYWQKHHGTASQAAYRFLRIFNYSVSALGAVCVGAVSKKRSAAAKHKFSGCLARLAWLLKPYGKA
jgi:GT2 family glycosyltransferase